MNHHIPTDESNYKEWSQKDVMIWIEMNLSNNGIDDKHIQSFLNEWKKLYITGAMLDTIKNDSDALNVLKSECDAKQAPIGIWLVIKVIVKNLGNENNKKDDQLYKD